MPRLKMSIVQQICRKITVVRGVVKPGTIRWAMDPTVKLRWDGSTQKSRRSARFIPQGIVVRNGKRHTVPRVLWFNMWDDRDRYNHNLFQTEMGDAEAQGAAIYEKMLLDQDEQEGGKVRMAPVPHMWRSRARTDLQIQRPIWVCMSERELYLKYPEGEDCEFSLTPYSLFEHMGQPFAAIPQPKKHPMRGSSIQVMYMVRGPRYGSKGRLNQNTAGLYAVPDWIDPVPKVHPSIVGNDRVLMMSYYFNGATDVEALSFVRGRRQNQKAESTSYAKHGEQQIEELYP